MFSPSPSSLDGNPWNPQPLDEEDVKTDDPWPEVNLSKLVNLKRHFEDDHHADADEDEEDVQADAEQEDIKRSDLELGRTKGKAVNRRSSVDPSKAHQTEQTDLKFLTKPNVSRAGQKGKGPDQKKARPAKEEQQDEDGKGEIQDRIHVPIRSLTKERADAVRSKSTPIKTAPIKSKASPIKNKASSNKIKCEEWHDEVLVDIAKVYAASPRKERIYVMGRTASMASNRSLVTLTKKESPRYKEFMNMVLVIF